MATKPEPAIRILVNGRVALTVLQAAERYGLAESSMRSALSRFGRRARPVAKLDRQKSLYLQHDLDILMKQRPGKGNVATEEEDQALSGG
ncbi:MAG TPA: hypothetical protein VFM54_09300 [Micromonosporaceae bacterium]|nr:hypothetical protein [Micromonosporaceae bacterium]